MDHAKGHRQNPKTKLILNHSITLLQKLAFIANKKPSFLPLSAGTGRTTAIFLVSTLAHRSWLTNIKRTKIKLCNRISAQDSYNKSSHKAKTKT